MYTNVLNIQAVFFGGFRKYLDQYYSNKIERFLLTIVTNWADVWLILAKALQLFYIYHKRDDRSLFR